MTKGIFLAATTRGGLNISATDMGLPPEAPQPYTDPNLKMLEQKPDIFLKNENGTQLLSCYKLPKSFTNSVNPAVLNQKEFLLVSNALEISSCCTPIFVPCSFSTLFNITLE